MAYRTGTALHYRDLLRQLRHFVTGRATVGAITQTGTGNGTLTQIEPIIAAVTQTWTLTCTVAGATGTFTVSGSVSGALASATVGTAYSNLQIGFLLNDGAIDFAVGAQLVFTVTASTMIVGERWLENYWLDQETKFTGTGNGTLTGITNTPTNPVSQTWTLTCTVAGATGTFSVVGSSSGAMANATVGTAYSNAQVSFTLNDGAVDFAVGDKFVFSVNWQELYLKGPGIAAADEIFVGFNSFQDDAVPYHVIRVGGYTAYASGSSFTAQPGALPSGQFYPAASLSNDPMTYWMTASGRRMTLVVKVGALYETLTSGFILPYATPGQYPYPLFIGGSINGVAGYQSSLTGATRRHFVDPGGTSTASLNTTARLRAPDGTWLALSNLTSEAYDSGLTNLTFPYGSNDPINAMREAPGDVYPLTPIALMTTVTPNWFGEMDGCYHVSGFNNAPENIVTLGGVNHLVVQNVYRTGISNFWALKLE